MRDSATAPISERAWARVGDVYFQAERYDHAKRAYQGLLEHFAGSSAASLAMLRLALVRPDPRERKLLWEMASA